MVVSTYSDHTPLSRFNHPVCRVANSPICLFVVLMKRYFLNLIKNINMYVVSLLLSVVYLLVIIPYHFFLCKAKGKWVKKEQETDINFQYMW